MTKICNRCETEQSISEFGIDKITNDGHRATCRTCIRKKQRQRRQSNLVLARQKERDWWNTHKTEILQRRNERRRQQREKVLNQEHKRNSAHPEKYKAGLKVRAATKWGRLPKIYDQSCATCGRQAQQYHHWSYLPENWLSVIPVCTICHGAIHRGALEVNPTTMAIEGKPPIGRWNQP